MKRRYIRDADDCFERLQRHFTGRVTPPVRSYSTLLTSHDRQDSVMTRGRGHEKVAVSHVGFFFFFLHEL